MNHLKLSKGERKAIALNEIKKHKDILFAHNNIESKERKEEIWKIILQKCLELRLVPPNKGFIYVRDVFWSNMRRATLYKIEGTKQSRKRRVKDKTLNELDHIVLSILNTSTKLLSKINIGEQYEIQKEFDDFDDKSIKLAETTNQSDKSCIELQSDPITFENILSISNETQSTNTSFQSSVVVDGEEQHPHRSQNTIKSCQAKDLESNEIKRKCDFKDKNNLKKQKLLLEIENLEMQNYKAKLEILELERKLYIGPSKFTLTLEPRRH